MGFVSSESEGDLGVGEKSKWEIKKMGILGGGVRVYFGGCSGTEMGNIYIYIYIFSGHIILVTRPEKERVIHILPDQTRLPDPI